MRLLAISAGYLYFETGYRQQGSGNWELWLLVDSPTNQVDIDIYSLDATRSNQNLVLRTAVDTRNVTVNANVQKTAPIKVALILG